MKDELIRCRDCAYCTIVKEDYGKSEHCNLPQLNATYCNLLKMDTDEDGFCYMAEKKDGIEKGWLGKWMHSILRCMKVIKHELRRINLRK